MFALEVTLPSPATMLRGLEFSRKGFGWGLLLFAPKVLRVEDRQAEQHAFVPGQGVLPLRILPSLLCCRPYNIAQCKSPTPSLCFLWKNSPKLWGRRWGGGALDLLQDAQELGVLLPRVAVPSQHSAVASSPPEKAPPMLHPCSFQYCSSADFRADFRGDSLGSTVQIWAS